MNRHFRVVISCCPSQQEKVWSVEESSLKSSTTGETFTFDKVFTENGGQGELYEQAVSPLITSALDGGHDAFVLAYGLPCTGKTYSVFGPLGQTRLQRETRGIVARIGQQVFDTVCNDSICKVSASFCHIFEDGRVTDLFDSRRRRLDVVEDRSNTNTYTVPSLSSHPVCSPLDLSRLTEKANLMRNASGGRKEQPNNAHTVSKSNIHSYKPHCSHAFIQFVVERLQKGRGTGEEEIEGESKRVSRTEITVVDLAGHSIGLVQSGQQCSDTGIFTLHKIMTTLPSQGIVATANLFPNSSLTKLLKPCLGGNSETVLVGTVSLSTASSESTSRCLQLLNEAAQIKNYCRHTMYSLSESTLGKTLQQITNLRSDICSKLGTTEQQSQGWQVGQEQGKDYVEMNGERYSDLSGSCCSLLQKLDKLEAQILHNGVCNSRKIVPGLPVATSKLPGKMNIPGIAVAPRPLPHMTKPVTNTSLQQSQSHSLSSSSLDTSSSEDETSQPSTIHSGPPPPPLRGIPHVIPDSTFIPPRPTSNSRSTTPTSFRPSSGHSYHYHEQSLASSSQVSSAVSGWSDVPSHYNQPGSPTGSSSQSSSTRHPPIPSSHPHITHSLVSHTHRPPQFQLHTPSNILPNRPVGIPLRPPHTIQLARPILPRPLRPLLHISTVRPRLPLPLATGIKTSTPLMTSTPPPSGIPLSSLPNVITPSSTPGSLTPNAGSPIHTPSPSPIPPNFNNNTTSPSHHRPRQLPPISPSSLYPLVTRDNMTSSSSSLTLTDSDLSQEALDTFDPVIRNRSLSMQRTVPLYNGSMMTGSSSLPQQEDAPPYNNNTTQGGGGGMRGDNGGGGRIRDMSEYTSREEIHVAAMEGVKSSELKKLAIQYGVDYRDHGGRTPLMYAVLGNQPRMCDTLLNLGAKVNTQDGTGLTPLLWATFQAKRQCMKILLRHGADIHARDSEGRSVFHWAVKSPNINCLKALQKQATPTIVNIADKDGLTPLHWAVLCKQPTHTHLLLTSAGADSSIQDPEGRTALTHAVLNSSSACIKVILEVCENAVNYRDEKGRTVLHYACAEGSTDCVRTLISAHSCDIHSRDNRGTTPLHWAAAANQPSIIQLLLRRGVDRSLKDNDDLTAVEHAEVRGHTECAHILHNYGLHRPSSALSVASQVSVHTLPPQSLDKHGHVSLSLPHRKFSLTQSSLPRPPADGEDHPDDTDHTHRAESLTHNQQVECTDNNEVGGVRRRRQWSRYIICCLRHNNTIMPASN